jgi:hypothetical protein
MRHRQSGLNNRCARVYRMQRPSVPVEPIRRTIRCLHLGAWRLLDFGGKVLVYFSIMAVIRSSRVLLPRGSPFSKL